MISQATRPFESGRADSVRGDAVGVVVDGATTELMRASFRDRASLVMDGHRVGAVSDSPDEPAHSGATVLDFHQLPSPTRSGTIQPVRRSATAMCTVSPRLEARRPTGAEIACLAATCHRST